LAGDTAREASATANLLRETGLKAPGLTGLACYGGVNVLE
jgi:hypothetical protein